MTQERVLTPAEVADRLRIRLAAMTDASGGPESCWPFTGWRDRYGYGRITYRRKLWLSHRAAWLVAHGSIPADLQILHACDNPPCVNPAHLWLGTIADNVADRDRKGRTRRDPNHRGERTGTAKLRESDIPDIRVALGTGRSAADVAREYGVSDTTIRYIRDRKRWAHVR